MSGTKGDAVENAGGGQCRMGNRTGARQKLRQGKRAQQPLWKT